jgi:outer membrane protein assembly factor BamB
VVAGARHPGRWGSPPLVRRGITLRRLLQSRSLLRYQPIRFQTMPPPASVWCTVADDDSGWSLTRTTGEELATDGRSAMEVCVRPIRLSVALILWFALLTNGLPASAVGPTLSLHPTSHQPTVKVRVRGAGFGASELVDISFDAALVAMASTDESGAFLTRFRVPASATPGLHPVTAVGQSSGLQAMASFLVTTYWRGLHFDLKTNRYNRYENVLDPSSVVGLTERWSSMATSGFPSSPAVADGVVYVGSWDEHVYALDASTGAEQWSFDTGDSAVSSPAVDRGVVYVGTATTLRALDASTGGVLWTFGTGGTVWSSPAVLDGVVYVGATDGKVYAVNARTGTMLWSFATGSTIFYSSPAVAKGLMYIGSTDHNIYALDASTGAQEWSFTTGGAITWSSPAVAYGLVFVGSGDGKIYALDASTGAQEWSFTTGGEVTSSPAVANGVVYVGSVDGNVYALDAITGAKSWSYSTGGGSVYSSPAVAAGVLYGGTWNAGNRVFALDSSNGTELWSFGLGEIISASPAVADGMVLIGSYFGGIHAFGL